MKEIKFRLIRNNKIVGYCEFNSWRPKYIEDNTTTWKPIVHDKKDLFTGFKDKNNKDIYEGDILKLSCIDTFGEKKEWVCDVTWRKGFIHPLPLDDWEVEVIGNIYENKELIKGK